MVRRRWSFTVHDVAGRTYRGAVVHGDATRADMARAGRERFRIVLLEQPTSDAEAPAGTAICAPALTRLHTAGEPLLALARRIEDVRLTSHGAAAYGAGRIVVSAGPPIEAGDIFPVHGDRPRLDRLALAVVEAEVAEAIAPYIAVIRHELGLRADADAALAVESRLTPPEPASRPPVRAPATVRLRRTARALREGRAPDVDLETLTVDLRFLCAFDDSPMEREGMARLLDAVLDARPARKPAAIIPFRKPGEQR